MKTLLLIACLSFVGCGRQPVCDCTNTPDPIARDIQCYSENDSCICTGYNDYVYPAHTFSNVCALVE